MSSNGPIGYPEGRSERGFSVLSVDAPALVDAVREPRQLDLAGAAALPSVDVLAAFDSSERGLASVEASRRLEVYGPNVLRSRGVSALSVLVRQVRSYLLGLLLVAAVVSAVVGDVTEALIIGGIMAMSVGLSFMNEYRSERAVEALHSQIQHLAFVERDGKAVEVNVATIIPGDVVHLRVGDVVPADLRVLAAQELECDESVLTGESRASVKTPTRSRPATHRSISRPACSWERWFAAVTGAGSVVCTGAQTAFGAIALRLGERQGRTRVPASCSGILASAGDGHRRAGGLDLHDQDMRARPLVSSRRCSRSRSPSA